MTKHSSKESDDPNCNQKTNKSINSEKEKMLNLTRLSGSGELKTKNKFLCLQNSSRKDSCSTLSERKKSRNPSPYSNKDKSITFKKKMANVLKFDKNKSIKKYECNKSQKSPKANKVILVNNNHQELGGVLENCMKKGMNFEDAYDLLLKKNFIQDNKSQKNSQLGSDLNIRKVNYYSSSSNNIKKEKKIDLANVDLSEKIDKKINFNKDNLSCKSLDIFSNDSYGEEFSEVQNSNKNINNQIEDCNIENNMELITPCSNLNDAKSSLEEKSNEYIDNFNNNKKICNDNPKFIINENIDQSKIDEIEKNQYKLINISRKDYDNS
jgi:hypothetical protein